MQSRTLLNVVLLLLIAGLVALVVYEPGIEPPAEPAKLSPLKADDISRIKIVLKNEAPIILEKTDTHWWLQTPVRLRADETTVKHILTLLDETSFADYPAAGLDPATTGLNDPPIQLWFNDAEIRLGKRNPLQQQRYALSGGRVHMITDKVSHRLSGDHTRYVARTLLPENARIQRLELPDLRLEQVEGKWKVTPEQPQASADDLQILIDHWRRTQAMDVTPYQATEGEGTIRIDLDGETVEFDILETAPEFILGRKDLAVQYHMLDSALGQLLRLNSSHDTAATP
ncbi:MAG: DUF4340 domain-containing protein [Pseudomonadota bacterium]